MSIDFAKINAAARTSVPGLLASWVPGGKRQGREWVGRNPLRSDRTPGSFSINMDSGRWSDFATGDKGGDFVSLFAFLQGGISQGDAARQLAKDLGIDEVETVADLANVAGRTEKNESSKRDWQAIMPVPSDAPRLTDEFVQSCASPGYKFTVGYRYTSIDGEWLGSTARYDRKANGLPVDKEFRSFVFCSGPNGKLEWRCQGFPLLRPLYLLHLLAARPTAPVIVTEGEKSAEAAVRLFPSHSAVTSPNGSKSAGKADWSSLAGRHVVIWPDADEPGARYATESADLIRAAGAASVRTVEMPEGLPVGWDLADALPEGVTSADLEKLLSGAQDAPVDGPLPLFPELPPAEPYPVEALGPVLAQAAAAIASKVQVPPAMAGQSVLAAAALAAQAHADVLLPYGQTRPLSLFLVTVAASGDRKSTADNEALWPVTKHEKTLREQNTNDMTAWRIVQGAWAAEKKKIEADKKVSFDERQQRLKELGEEPPRPLAPFLTSGDLTIEGLTKNWPNAHAALGIFTAEAGTFTGGHGMSEDARLRTAAMLSEVWDGKPVKRVRALDGVTILPGRRLSMHLMVQPDAAAGFLGNGTLRDQGLLSRVLVAAPHSLAGTRMHREVEPADEAAIRFYGARILSLLEASLPLVQGTQNELDLPALTIDADAKIALAAFADHVERQCGASYDLKPIGDFAAKAAEHAARIAGVLTIVDSQRATTIGMAAMTNALALADWYVVETLRLHQAGRRDPKLLQAHRLLKWMRARTSDTIKFSDILQFGPTDARTKAEAEQSIEVLVNHRWLVEASPRPKAYRLAEGTR